MKRILISIIAAVAVATGAQAQNYLIENPDNKPYLGVRVGLDISSTAGAVIDTYNNGAGFTVGAIYNIPLWKNLYFEPGVHIFYNTFGEEINTTANPELPILLDCSLRNWGFRIPLNFGYRFDFTDDISIALYTGPVLNTNLTAKYHMPHAKTESIMENGFKRLDMQWDFGVSFCYGQHYYASVGGGVGVTRVFKDAMDHFRRNTVNISIGYNF